MKNFKVTYTIRPCGHEMTMDTTLRARNITSARRKFERSSMALDYSAYDVTFEEIAMDWTELELEVNRLLGKRAKSYHTNDWKKKA